MTAKKSTVVKKTKGTYHHGDLKSTLKGAALRLVLEKGPRGFSINEASRLAGVTVAAPYRHFEDKDALLAEIATDGFGRLAEDVQNAATAAPQTGAVLAAGLAYLRFAAKHRDYFAVMFGAGLDKTKYPLLEVASREAFGTIHALIAATETNRTVAQQRAVACWAFVHGLSTLTADGAVTSDSKQGLHIDPPALLGDFVKKMSLA
jgi:AcrR family transcriptional regulator